MKTLALAVALFFLATIGSWATAVLVIDIQTKGNDVAYYLNGEKKSLKELEELIGKILKSIPPNGVVDDLYLRPDDATAYKTVLTLVQKLQASGAQLIHITMGADSQNQENAVYLTVEPKSIQTEKGFHEEQEKKK